ncbi:MAG: hypothetical protein IIC51_00265 [Planctomycetes bacterium]|nr:hypothetical protein [Planctomycetota bacterium]
MRSIFVSLAAVACFLVATGCSITGSWRRIATDPPNMPFPVDLVAFDQHDRYTATWMDQDQTRTSTGRYDWNGSRLIIQRPNAEPRIYQGRLRLDGTLVLTYQVGGDKVSAILKKTDE